MDDDWFDDSESLYPEGMDGPTIDPPSVGVPEAADDVFQRSPIARLFLIHVVVWNAVVLFVSLGVMLIYFRNDWTLGGRLLVAGGVLTVYGLYRWPREVGETDDSSESGASAEPTEEDAPDAADPAGSPADGDSTVDS